MKNESIHIHRARQNNLQGFDLKIPLDGLTVITGVSGSGKSSLAFDTLYAEGQRRYVASFSSYTRQFLERLPAPDVDSISGLPPAIALKPSGPGRAARSTVGTLTEILDHLHVLWARAAVPDCASCGSIIRRHTVESITQEQLANFDAQRIWITFRVPVGEEPIDELVPLGLSRAGFLRVLLDGEEHRVDELEGKSVPGGVLDVVADRFKASSRQRGRLLEALELAFDKGKGRARIQSTVRGIDVAKGLVCATCQTTFEVPSPALFSFNNPLGACAECRGFGRIIINDPNKVIPDHTLSLEDHAIKLLSAPRFKRDFREMLAFCRVEGIPTDVPWKRLKKKHRDLIWNGGQTFCGIQPFLDWMERKSYKMHVRIQLARFRGYVSCPSCEGARLKPEARRYRLSGASLPELTAMPVREARAHLASVRTDMPKSLHSVLDRVDARLSYLEDTGLDYLSLDRPARTLSGGEAQRVHLTSALGASLSSTLFVLDEPSVGLHSRDSARLVKVLSELRAAGNTVVVVEHEIEIMAAADHLVDLGPGAGERGGQLLFEGHPRTLARSKKSLTRRCLEGEERAEIPSRRKAQNPRHVVRVRGARANNLQNLDVDIPLGLLVSISGVSGSGKSTLVDRVLYSHLAAEFGDPQEDVGECDRVDWKGPLDGVVRVDQSPPGRSSRSNPATYVGAWDGIRKRFGEVATEQGLEGGARLFSFNVAGGRCPNCKGEGAEVVDMQFLADIRLTCPACGGKRFTAETLSVRWQGLSIADVLELTVQEAWERFDGLTKVAASLRPLIDIGLGYLRLGQPTSTLSGGEAQRLKLARHLNQDSKGSQLFILDEPTTGLHLADVAVLSQALHRLVEHGHSVLVVEHHLDLIATSDYVLDLGPEGGPEGGRVLVQGTPEDVANHPGSYTGKYLKELLQGQSPLKTQRSQEAT